MDFIGIDLHKTSSHISTLSEGGEHVIPAGLFMRAAN
jgi:hypothetical protein